MSDNRDLFKRSFLFTDNLSGSNQSGSNQSAIEAAELQNIPPACFAKYYAPLEPLILLLNNKSIGVVGVDVLKRIEEFLQREQIPYEFNGSRFTVDDTFYVNVYKSRRNADHSILEISNKQEDAPIDDRTEQIKALF